MKLVVRELKKQGIEASEELTLKKIATQNKTNPTDVYERIKKLYPKLSIDFFPDSLSCSMEAIKDSN